MTHDYKTDPELDEIAARPEAERALRRMITAYAGAGTVLVAIAALGLAGFGPFAS